MEGRAILGPCQSAKAPSAPSMSTSSLISLSENPQNPMRTQSPARPTFHESWPRWDVRVAGSEGNAVPSG